MIKKMDTQKNLAMKNDFESYEKALESGLQKALKLLYNSGGGGGEGTPKKVRNLLQRQPIKILTDNTSCGEGVSLQPAIDMQQEPIRFGGWGGTAKPIILKSEKEE